MAIPNTVVALLLDGRLEQGVRSKSLSGMAWLHGPIRWVTVFQRWCDCEADTIGAPIRIDVTAKRTLGETNGFA